MSDVNGSSNLGRFGAWRWLQRMFGGTMFNGARDLYEAYGYKRNLTFDDFLFKYLKQDVARRIIDMPVFATWADPPTLTADDKFMEVWQNVVTSHRLWHKILMLDKLTGIGQFGILVIGLDDSKQLNSPATIYDSTNVPTVLRNITYLQPYMERSVKITAFETDEQSPRFGQPLMYRIDPQSANLANSVSGLGSVGAAKRQAFDCHWTRILHIADNTLENNVYGTSRLEHVYNLLEDLMKIVGGSAETYWMVANRGLQADVDKEMELDPDDAANLEAELTEFQHNLRRIVRTRGVKINNIGSDTADPSGVFQVLMSMLSAATGIPKMELLGVEAGEMASAQNRANWADRVAERVANYAEPTMLLPLIWRLISLGVLTTPETLNISWPEAYKLSPLERGQTSAQMARSAANLTKMISAPIGSFEFTETTITQRPATPTPTETDTDPKVNSFGITPAQPMNTVTLVKKWVEGGESMFTIEEARSIVGFGKTMPVFDDKDDSKVPS